jgi:hypothetical protein
MSIGKTDIYKQVEDSDRDFQVGDIVKMRNGGVEHYKIVERLPDGRWEILIPQASQTWKVQDNWIERA